MLYSDEMNIIEFVHQFRTPLLDQFFKFMNYFDSREFFFVLIPLIWIGQGWKTGLRIFSILFLGDLSSHFLKAYFQLPRPFDLDPSLGLIHVGGFGFPSGAAQNAMLLSCLLLTYWKSHWKWIVTLSYFTILSFSRIYLGVHFPTDLLGGWLVGFVLWTIYMYVFPPVEQKLQKLRPNTLFIYSQLIPLSILWLRFSTGKLIVCSIAMGLGVGLYIMHKKFMTFLLPKNAKEFALKAVIAVSGMFACDALTLLLTSMPKIFLFLPYFLIGLWISLGSQLIYTSLDGRGKVLNEK